MTTRHEFLAMLHANLKPRGYLEIGVLFGDSLRLAQCPAIGIDPDPRIRYHLSSQVYATTSDDFFSVDHTRELLTFDIDLAFIDGEHLYEYALRDFMNIERYSNPRTVIVFDDVLPRNQAEAAREQCPGDWTGDEASRLARERIGERALTDDLRGWVSDGLMTVFFLVVGLEIKRELVTGELRDLRRAALPVVAANA